MNNKFFTFLLVISIFVTSNNGASQISQPKHRLIERYKSVLLDSMSTKDLKKLSEFTDTAKLNRFVDEIHTFQTIDTFKLNIKADVVFTGSSSLRKWKTLENDFSTCNLLNRSFGGSTIPEVIYFSDVLLFKYHPSKIVLYAGENDISNTKTSVKMVVESFKYFHQLVSYHLPASQIYYVSIKPSPSRVKWWPKMKEVNNQIKRYCDSSTNCNFIDVSSRMLTKEGTIRKDIFLKDMLHLNEKGYQIWAEEIGKALECKINKRL